ncbi:hypothetical protein, partial [Acinetobacter sp. V2]
QLEYWQAIEDGAEIEEEPKKKKKNKKKIKKHEELTADDLPQENAEEVATLKQK